jgi:hypothetical protein
MRQYVAHEGHARLQEAGEVAPLAQLGDAQLYRGGPGLPVTVAVTVALNEALVALLAVAGAGQTFDLQLHQPLGRKADLISRSRSASGVFSTRARRFIISSVSVAPRIWLVFATRPYHRIIDDHPPSRSLAEVPGSLLKAILHDQPEIRI